VVLTLIVAALLLAGLVAACYWLAAPGAGVSGGAKAAVRVTVLVLALCTAGLVPSIRRARRNVGRHQRIAELAGEAASRASAHDVESPPETTWIVSGRQNTELRLDVHEITLRQRGQTRWIAWDDVRWFRDGEYFHLSRRLRKDGWALAIALKDGGVVIPDATRKPWQASRQTLTAARQAARQHAIPAVLTGRPVSGQPSPADKPGLYPDPGGEPGLREWTGTEWLPSLLVDPTSSGPHGEQGPASIWSPLSREEQQRQWDTAIAAVPRWHTVVGQVFAVACVFANMAWWAPILLVQGALKHGYWLGMSPAAAVPSTRRHSCGPADGGPSCCSPYATAEPPGRSPARPGQHPPGPRKPLPTHKQLRQGSLTPRRGLCSPATRAHNRANSVRKRALPTQFRHDRNRR
jgi:hypothetical protein